ncbi:hypothetical protein AALP_AA2G191000 [Arabis alpina]|uniref:Uncharacterized protein n=1 Tax=Arabis alpina TaxID=50452 RepID=A0A087HII3_ARAAL|nr:hypothetical protein AALP_AA2G191000 [Arabis alpina]
MFDERLCYWKSIRDKLFMADYRSNSIFIVYHFRGFWYLICIGGFRFCRRLKFWVILLVASSYGRQGFSYPVFVLFIPMLIGFFPL